MCYAGGRDLGKAHLSLIVSLQEHAEKLTKCMKDAGKLVKELDQRQYPGGGKLSTVRSLTMMEITKLVGKVGQPFSIHLPALLQQTLVLQQTSTPSPHRAISFMIGIVVGALL